MPFFDGYEAEAISEYDDANDDQDDERTTDRPTRELELPPTIYTPSIPRRLPIDTIKCDDGAATTSRLTELAPELAPDHAALFSGLSNL